MVFSSIVFLTAFLPAVLILYYVLRGKRMRNAILILASLFFYAYGEAWRVILLIACAVWNWGMARLIGKASGRPLLRKLTLFVTVAADLGILCVFKYTGMIADTLRQLTGIVWNAPEIALPIGISFFTFQAIGYVADVYRGTVEPRKNLAGVLLYICFFPQLVAGPIVRYRDIESELSERVITPQDVAQGMNRFLYGLSKKVLIANTVASLADQVYALPEKSLSMPIAWLGAIAYAIQIYFDFSGYSDMAIGLGRMFGFHFMENFRHPYAASNMLEFWRRWHISLTDWFRENVYIPLGGNRKGKVLMWRNRLIVFFLTGLWHGASWNFVLWGLYHGIITSLEAIIRGKKEQHSRIGRLIGHLYVAVVVIVGFVLFRAETLTQAWAVIRAMFVPRSITTEQIILLGNMADTMSLVAVAAGIVLSFPIAQTIYHKWKNSGKAVKLAEAARYGLSVLLLLLCMSFLAGGSYNPFIYYRF